MQKRSAVMSQMRSFRVTLKRVTTNQPEKIETAIAAQIMPAHRSLEPARDVPVETAAGERSASDMSYALAPRRIEAKALIM